MPEQIADHDLLRLISSGSYGDVWLAKNQLTGTYRAIKIVWRDSFDTAKPYEREFEAITRFEPLSRRHPGFIHILQTGKLENGFYYIMELADSLAGGETDSATYKPATLAALRMRAMEVGEAIRIGILLTKSLEVLHEAGLIHRDIKPSNVIFVGGQPKLADIGLVSAISEANSVVGTNGFIAPEGPTSKQADIYSLGKLLYEIATGRDRLDFPKLPEEVTVQESLLLELNQILLKACHTDPRQRHASVVELRDELEFLAQGRSIRRVRQLEQAVRWLRVSLVAGCIIMIAGYFVLKSREIQRAAASQILERRIGSAIAKGNESVKNGDYLAAVHFFARGALLEPENFAEHRFRLGSALAYGPTVEAIFKSDSNASCFSEASRILATSAKGQVKLTDLLSRKVVRELNHRASGLGTSPEGTTLSVWETEENYVTMLNLSSGREDIHWFGDSVWHVSLAQAGRFAVTTASGEVYLFPGRREIVEPDEPVYKAVLSPSGKYLCLLQNKGGFKVLDTDTLAQFFAGRHEYLGYAAVFLNDETEVITCSFDRTARGWNVSNGKPIGAPMQHDDGVFHASVSPNGSLLATASLDRTVRIWKIPGFSPTEENHVLYHRESVVWVKFLSDSSLLAHCSDGTSWLWSITSNPQLREEEPFSYDVPPRHQAVGASSRLGATNSIVAGTIAGQRFSIDVNEPIEAIALDPREELVAVGTTDGSRAHHSVVLFDRAGRRTGRPMEHTDGITYVTFSHDGTLIGTCSEDFTARVWARDGEPVSPFLRHKNQVRWLSFSDDGEWVVTGSWDKTVRVWTARTGVPVTVPIKVGNLVDYVTFRGKDALFLANSRRNYTLKLPIFDGDIRELLAGSSVIDDEQF